MEKIKVGDKMFVGSENFTTKLEDLQEVPVSKVGNKYITVKMYSNDIQFHVDTLKRKSEFTTTNKLFFSRDEYETQKNFSDKVNRVSHKVGVLNNFYLKKWSEEDLDSLEKLLEKYNK